VEILGVTVQDDLKWNLHVDTSIKKAAKRLYFLVKLKRANVPVKQLTNFYVACVRTVLLYACQVFHHSLPEYLSINMERIQKRAMWIIHGYDTPYEQALAISRIPSLSQRRDELCSTLFDKIVVQQEEQLYKYLQPNTIREDKVNLRRKRPFVIPRCKTNRFKNTFLNASAINYDKIHSL
jgi:hypothetical protein